jgi:hypothetical protein
MTHSRWTAMRIGWTGLAFFACSICGAAEIEQGLPKKTTAILTVNFKQLLHASLVRHHGLATLRQACRNTEEARVFLEALGVDPLRDLDRLTVACVGHGEKPSLVYILRGRFDTSRFAAAAKRLAKDYGERFEIKKEEDLKYLHFIETGGHGTITLGAGVHPKKGPVLSTQTTGCLLDLFAKYCITLADKNTLVVATSDELLKETCKHLGDPKTSSANKTMRRLLAELDGKQTIAFAVCPPPPTLEAVSTGEDKEGKEDKTPATHALRELTGGISLADDFKLRCTIKTTSVEEARKVMEGCEEVRLRLDGLMTFLSGSSKEYAFLKEVPRSFLAVRKGNVLLIEGRLSAEMLNRLLAACPFNVR